MLRKFLSLSAVLLAGACAAGQTIEVPVTGSLGDKAPFKGVARASTNSPLGVYLVQTADERLTCHGSYNAADVTPRIIVAVSCQDGRYGAIELLRTIDLMSGTGKGTLNDGTPVRVAFGEKAGG